MAISKFETALTGTKCVFPDTRSHITPLESPLILNRAEPWKQAPMNATRGFLVFSVAKCTDLTML